MRNGVLDVSDGDITLAGFTGGNVTLDGNFVFGAKVGGDAYAEADIGNLIVSNAGGTLGANTKIIVDGTLAQAICTSAAANAFDNTVAHSVLLIQSNAGTGITYSNYLGSTGTKELQTALGLYTLTTGDKLTTGDAKDLYISNAQNTVDFTSATGVDTDNQKNFASNMGALYGSQILSSGLMNNVFGAAIENSGVVDGDLLTGYADRKVKSDAVDNPVGYFNEAFLSAMANGYGTPFAANESGEMSFVSVGGVEMAMGANVAKSSSVNQGAAMQSLTGVNARLGQIRMQQAALGLDSGDALASAMLNANVANRIWAGGLGMWEDADQRDGFAGYKYDSYGVQVGYDHLFGPVTVGAAFGYQTGDFKDKANYSNDSTIDNYSFNLYATYNHTSGFFATVMGGYTLSDNDMSYTNGSGSMKEDYHANSWYAEGKIGYDIRANAFTLTPSVGLGYVRTDSKSHDLNRIGTGAIARYGKQKSDTGYLPISLDATYDICTGNGNIFTVSANGGYTYNFDNDPAHGYMAFNNLTNSGVYSITGASRGHNMWNVGAGLKYSADRWEVGAKYDYFAKADADAHRVFGYVGIKF